jgi:photosystem II stability/assembly factor-like uncharacterized protein
VIDDTGGAGGTSDDGGPGGGGTGGTAGAGGKATEESGGSSASGGKTGSGGKTSTGGTGGGAAGSGGQAQGNGGKTGSGGAGGGNGGSGGGMVPPVDGDWTNVTGSLSMVQSECGTLGYLRAKPDEDLLIAGIALNGLYGTSDGGKNWHALGTGSNSDKMQNRPSALVFDPDHPKTFWESGIYTGSGVFVTKDDGVTFTHLGDIGSIDEVSVDLGDPDRKTLLAGGHEISQTLYRSTDGGQTWNNVGVHLPSGTCTHPMVVDSKTHLVGCSGYGGGATGVYRTVDGGTTWNKATDLGGGGRSHLEASNGNIYWLNATNSGLAVSKDKGQTWMQVADAGLTTSPVELPGGALAALGPDHVLVSTDEGKTWQSASPQFPSFQYGVSGLAYSPQQKAFFIWHEACGNPPLPVPDDAVLRYDFELK